MRSTDLIALDELRDNLYRLANIIDSKILNMQDPEQYSDSIRELFRQFHSLKALCYHLKMKSIFLTTKTIEEVLSILRQKKPPIKFEIIDWLLHISDSIKEWSQMAQSDDFDFKPIDTYILNMVKASVVVSRTPKEIMSDMHLVYMDDNIQRQEEFKRSIGNLTAKLNISSTSDKTEQFIIEKKCQILIINAKMNSENISVDILNIFDKYNIPILVVSQGNIDFETRLYYQQVGVEYFLNNFMNEDILLQRLVNIAKSYYEEKSIKLANNQILKQTSMLKPLSDTAFKINRLKSNPDCSIKDVGDIVSKDPLISAKILKIANSPFSGLKGSVSSIHHAVSLMGKEQIIALVLQAEMERFIRISLSPYMMTERDFYAIACMRMNLASFWYPKVSMAKTGLLATAALLANIGQLIIAQEVESTKISNRFRELIQTTSTPMFAEMEIFGTTSEDTTANILACWGLDDTLVNILHYANDTANANDDIKQEAIALFAILNTIPAIPIGIDDDKVSEVCEFLKEMNFNIDFYTKAVEKVKNECSF